MIKHEYLNADENICQWHADEIGRQEVSKEWAETTAIDLDIQLYAWISDEAAELSLDPWRLIDGPEDIPNARYFVSRKDLDKNNISYPNQDESGFSF